MINETPMTSAEFEAFMEQMRAQQSEERFCRFVSTVGFAMALVAAVFAVYAF